MPTRLDYPAWIPSVIAEGKLGSKRRKFVLNAFFGWDETMLPQSTRAEHQVGKVLGPPGLTLGVLGVVYGDIGTSPLYALKLAVKAASTTGLPSPAAVLGAVSLIFWSLILVSLKYVILMLRADNRGEGGILAIIALLGTRQPRPGAWYAALLLVGLVGAGLFYGEATIAPAISILAAVEGLKTEAPQFAPYVVPITILVLIGLFAFQRTGTGFIGQVFGPFMLLWFVTLALLGIRGILQAPEVLGAINPLSAVHYLSSVQPHVAFVIIGATFLAVTGGEAIYADLGHFGRRPIRLAWFTIVLPSLLLNYFGQGGMLLRDPDAIDNPFYQLAPGWAHYPLVLLAMRATTIASQAIISAAFSLTQQAMQLGLLPRMQVRYTAASAIGQIYMPAVNWLLAAATIALVLAFGSSDALAGAYGIAVSLLMAITTLLAGLVAIGWGYNPMAVVAVNGFFLVLDLFFFSANLLKFVQGGWFPLFLALTASFLMLTWRRGQLLVEQARARLRQPENEFLRDLVTQPPIPLPGMAVFLSSARTGVPLALTCFMRHTHALHGSVFLLSVETIKTPNVPESERVETSLLSDGVTRVILHFGFAQQPNVPEALNLAVAQGKLDETFRLSDCAYFVGRETIISASTAPKMSAWREALFAFMQRNSKREITCQGIPTFLVIQMGVEIQI